MILLIDNYDSFSYNLYQLIGAVEPDIKVVRNDECTLEEIAEMKPEAIILSPGPGRPEDAGICIPVIKEFGCSGKGSCRKDCVHCIHSIFIIPDNPCYCRAQMHYMGKTILERSARSEL